MKVEVVHKKSTNKLCDSKKKEFQKRQTAPHSNKQSEEK